LKQHSRGVEYSAVVLKPARKPGYRSATATISIRVLLQGDVNKDDTVDYREKVLHSSGI